MSVAMRYQHQNRVLLMSHIWVILILINNARQPASITLIITHPKDVNHTHTLRQIQAIKQTQKHVMFASTTLNSAHAKMHQKQPQQLKYIGHVNQIWIVL